MAWTVIDIEGRVRLRFLERYDEAPNIGKLADILSASFQEVEAGLNVVQGKTLEFADGTWLDRYGAIVDRPRRSDWTDEQYREQIELKIKAMSSRGTPEDIIDLAEAMRPSGSPGVVQFYTVPPAGYGLNVPVPSLTSEEEDYYASLIGLATPIGVQGTLVLWEASSPPFTFGGPGGTNGFGNGVFANTRTVFGE
ncbi:MAG: hypothetical protein B7733_05820 [Myxococcales bacterium FL481]|nr:MAG: hypothetical protein B7733_05820 [Myxococcales bacterium FL481]